MYETNFSPLATWNGEVILDGDQFVAKLELATDRKCSGQTTGKTKAFKDYKSIRNRYTTKACRRIVKGLEVMDGKTVTSLP